MFMDVAIDATGVQTESPPHKVVRAGVELSSPASREGNVGLVGHSISILADASSVPRCGVTF